MKLFYQKLNRLEDPVFVEFKRLIYVDDTLLNFLVKYVQELNL